MSVPSVATSISPHPSSASSFFSSHSHLAEPTMVTPTEGLISQQILSLPSSPTIVDMATLNSLDMHSCKGISLGSRNVEPLPSQESSSLTVDPFASNLTISKTTEYGGNIMIDQEKFKSSTLAELCHNTSNCNCVNVVGVQQTSYSSTTSNVKTKECSFLNMFGKDKEMAVVGENPSPFVDPLPQPILKMSDEIVAFKTYSKMEVGYVDVSNNSSIIQEVDIQQSVEETPSIYPNTFSENNVQYLSSVKSIQELHSGIENNCNEGTLIFPFHRDNINKFYFDKVESNGDSRYNSSNVQLSSVDNSLQLHPYFEGEVSSSFARHEPSFESPYTVDLSRCHLLETPCVTESNASFHAIPQFSDLSFQMDTSEFSGRSVSCSSDSDAKVLSIPHHLADNWKKQHYTLKSALIMNPSQHYITSDVIAEMITPEVKNCCNFTVPNSKNNVNNSVYLCNEMGETKFEEPLTLILAEVPAILDHVITFELSKILPEFTNRNLVFEKKAVFVKSSIDIKPPLSHKNGVLNLIKVTTAENYSLNSIDESSAFNKNLANDQIFVKINPAKDSLIKLNLTLWDKILPVNEIASSVEDSSNGYMSCTIIRLDEQFSTREENISLDGNSDTKPIYLGLLVPSSNFLHSLNVSNCQKDSLSISLSSSRPNQQYSTCTSIDLQFNGNNEDSIPIIPLGMYSPKGNSDPDSKWLTSFAENSCRDVQNVEDIFLIQRDIREGMLNPDVPSLKKLDFTDIILTKSSNCNHIPETGFLSKESNRRNYYDNIFSREIQLRCKASKKAKSSIPLKYFAERCENVCERMSNSNKIFNSDIEFHKYQSVMGKRQNKIKCKGIMTDLRCPSNLLCKNVDTVAVWEQGVPHMSNKNFTGQSIDCCLTPEAASDINHWERALCPNLKCNDNKQDSAHTNDAKFSSEKSVKEVLCGLKTSHISVVRDNFSLLRLKNDFKNNKSCNDVQKRTNKDQVGLEILDTNYYSLKRKIQAKRLEGYCRPFKISKTSKNKPGIELRKTKKTPDDESIKVREDLNSKLYSAMEPNASSWKLNHYGNACLSNIKNILASGAQLESNKNSLKGGFHGMEDSNNHTMNYRTDSGMLIIPQLSEYDSYSSHERAKQLSNFKSPDRKFSRNFLLSTSGSTKRSKLTIIIFCLAVTSLLISLHALSTDSSLYIKPTFFLVQEDDTASSFSSENSNPRKSPLHYSGKRKWGNLAVTNEPVLHSIAVKEENELVKGEEGMANSVTYVKSRKDMSKWAYESINVKSRNDMISKGGFGIRDTITTSSGKILENRQVLGVSKTPSSGFNESELNVSKSTSRFLNSVNFSVPKSNASSLMAGNNGDVPGFLLHNENMLSWNDNKFKGQNENNGKNMIDSSMKNSEVNVAGVFNTYGLNNGKTVSLSSSENQTKPSLLNNEGTTSSQNEFDLNIAFIEKNELNAAYGIDSGTTGVDGNIEDYAGEEEMTLLATSGNRVKFPKATRRLPQALIIGVRKGGTRALLEMLHLHPLVQKAAGEAHFFDRDENYAKGLQWYRRRMPPSLKGQITVEKSPSYFVTPEVPERVRAMNASIRLLLIVREPVTRAISDFAQLRSHTVGTKANTTIRTKLDGGAEEDYGKKLTRPLSSFESLAILPDGRVDMSWRPISVSLYHRHISAWLEAFPRDQILIVDGDQLASNPAPVLASVEKFLKLRPALTPTHFYFNATKGFYCLRSLPPGQQMDIMSMLPSPANHLPPLPEGKCLRESKGRRHPHVDPSVVHKLRRFFAEHNRRFYEMVGEDFGWPEE